MTQLIFLYFERQDLTEYVVIVRYIDGTDCERQSCMTE